MSVNVFQQRIPVNKIVQFHEILKATNGRYLYNPIQIGDTYFVSYYTTEYKEVADRYRMVTEGIKEIPEKNKIVKMLRKVKKFIFYWIYSLGIISLYFK